MKTHLALVLALGLSLNIARSQTPPSPAAPSPTPIIIHPITPPSAQPDLRAAWQREADQLTGAEVLENGAAGGSYVQRDVIVRGDVPGSVTVTNGRIYVLGTVRGNVSVVGGTITILGTVNGSVSVVGGSLRVAGTVQGRVSVIGGQIQRAPGGVIKGPTTKIGGMSGLPLGTPGMYGPIGELDWSGVLFHPLWLIWGGLLLVLWLVLAALPAAIWPAHFDSAAVALGREPVRFAATGLLFWIAFWFFAICALLASIFVVGVPFALLLSVLYLVVKWYGLTVVFAWIGRAILRRLGRAEASVLAVVAVGALTTGLIRLVPVAGFVTWQILGWLAAGVAVLNLAQQLSARRPITPASAGPA